MKRALFLALVAIAGLGASPARAAIPRPEGLGQRDLFRQVNAERQARGLPELKLAPGLYQRARFKACHIAGAGFLSHELSPRPAAGEAIALLSGRSTASSRTVVRAWLASPAHRPLVLSSSYRKLGVGVCVRAGRTAFTAELGR